jgi:hypothetical protein
MEGMRRLFLAVLLLVVPAAAGAQSPCAGIGIGFYEEVRPQGLFGLATPKARWDVVREAFRNAVELNREYPEVGKFRWDAVCRFAREKGIRKLWIGCRADTDEMERRHAGAFSRDAEHAVPQLTAECVISKYAGKNAGWNDLVGAALIPVGKDHQTYFSGSPYSDFMGHYDAIDDRKERMRLYERVLGDATERW